MYYKFTASCVSEKNILFPPTIIFFAYGREIRVHGFFQREVREMKELVEGNPKRCWGLGFDK